MLTVNYVLIFIIVLELFYLWLFSDVQDGDA
jgi:hypothetical protein